MSASYKISWKIHSTKHFVFCVWYCKWLLPRLSVEGILSVPFAYNHYHANPHFLCDWPVGIGPPS